MSHLLPSLWRIMFSLFSLFLSFKKIIKYVFKKKKCYLLIFVSILRFVVSSNLKKNSLSLNTVLEVISPSG